MKAFQSGLLPVACLLGSLTIAPAQNTPWAGTPVVQPVMPQDVKVPVSQFNFNNLAWQQFITLNWAADPANPGSPDPAVLPAAFGTALDTRPVVWESYKESSEVFRPDAEPPTPWNAPRAFPAPLVKLAQRHQLSAVSGVKGLFATSKFTGGLTLDLSEFGEAGTNNSWLTAQDKMNNYVTLFEKRINEDEFNYINNNQLYDAANQAPFAKTHGINLPDGSAGFASYGTVGAIEVKAAWIQLDDPSLWPLFKISKAYVSYPSATGPTPPKLVTVGLVGLHIIRKTPNAQQFMWSTFEHVNNSPSTADIQQQMLKAWYTYYNKNCDSSTDYYHCEVNHQPVYGSDPFNAPVQVVRTTPIGNSTSNNIVQLNQNVWNTIHAANPDSVFLNYQLVNVLWPNANTTIPVGAMTPLTNGNPQPSQPVANTIMETYHQDLTCLTCHTSAPVAAATQGKALKIPKITAPASIQSTTVSASGVLASDYSFLFSDAQSKPAPTPKETKPAQ